MRAAVAGVETTAFSLDLSDGLILLEVAPPTGASVTAGFEFDTPVRFDADRLEIDLSAFEAGSAPSIPLVEIRLA